MVKLPKPVSTDVTKLASRRARGEEKTSGCAFWELRLLKPQVVFALLGLWTISQAADAQSILPPAQGSIGGGNPLQGLGRPDDPSPSRYKDFAQTNLQATPSSGSGGAFTSDILDKSSLDSPDANPTESLDKLLSPDGLKSLTGSEGLDGSGSGAASGGGQSNSLEFTDKAGSSFAEQLQGSNVGDAPLSETESPDTSSSRTPAQADLYGSNPSSGGSSSSLSKTGSDDGNVGLPPEPPGLATPIKAPALSNSINATSLSSTPEKAEQSKTATKSAAAKTETAAEHASTHGAHAEHDASNRKASPLSTSVSERIRQALEGRGRTPKTPKAGPSAKAEQPPPEFQMVPAPPRSEVAPAGPTPERQALGLMKVGNYHLAERQLRDLVSSDPNNLHARYLFAVTLVFNKKYDEAKNNYGLIIRKSQDKRLIEMAEAGLHNLMH